MNYSEIVDLSLGYADRQDTDVTSRIDLFMRVAEARINRTLMTLDMSCRAKTPMSSTTEYYSLPPNYSVMRSIKVIDETNSDSRVTLLQVNPEQMANLVNNGETQFPCYTVISGNIHVQPFYDSTHSLEIDYFQTLPPLSTSITTNWLSDSNPDVYVFGILVEINSFIKDAEASALWDGRFQQAMSEITMNDAKSTWSGTSLTTFPG
jgi:hypothetical protein